MLRIRLKQLLGARIYSRLWELAFPHHGIDQFRDLSDRLPKFSPRVILDVGANIGQSADRLLRWYPGADIYCFEPVSSTFEMLSDNLRPFERVKCFQLAMGACSDMMEMEVFGPGDVANRLHKTSKNKDDSRLGALETVTVSTVADFCAENGIKSIDYLKVDAEGADLEVLHGTGDLLRPDRCHVVQVECAMSENNTAHTHVPFYETHEMLVSRGYLLFGIYLQAVPDGWPVLSHSDWVYVGEPLLQQSGKVSN